MPPDDYKLTGRLEIYSVYVTTRYWLVLVNAVARLSNYVMGIIQSLMIRNRKLNALAGISSIPINDF